MFVQIAFCVLVLTAQVVPQIPDISILIGTVLVLFIAASSGFDYVMSWTVKAVRTHREQE
jgi:cardiolipin synthase